MSCPKRKEKTESKQTLLCGAKRCAVLGADLVRAVRQPELTGVLGASEVDPPETGRLISALTGDCIMTLRGVKSGLRHTTGGKGPETPVARSSRPRVAERRVVLIPLVLSDGVRVYEASVRGRVATALRPVIGCLADREADLGGPLRIAVRAGAELGQARVRLRHAGSPTGCAGPSLRKMCSRQTGCQPGRAWSHDGVEARGRGAECGGRRVRGKPRGRSDLAEAHGYV